MTKQSMVPNPNNQMFTPTFLHSQIGSRLKQMRSNPHNSLPSRLHMCLKWSWRANQASTEHTDSPEVSRPSKQRANPQNIYTHMQNLKPETTAACESRSSDTLAIPLGWQYYIFNEVGQAWTFTFLSSTTIFGARPPYFPLARWHAFPQYRTSLQQAHMYTCVRRIKVLHLRTTRYDRMRQSPELRFLKPYLLKHHIHAPS